MLGQRAADLYPNHYRSVNAFDRRAEPCSVPRSVLAFEQTRMSKHWPQSPVTGSSWPCPMWLSHLRSQQRGKYTRCDLPFHLAGCHPARGCRALPARPESSTQQRCAPHATHTFSESAPSCRSGLTAYSLQNIAQEEARF